MPEPMLLELRTELQALANPADAENLQRFFKTGPGEYGEGDRFLGIRVPALRRLARSHRSLSVGEALELLCSSWHEERMLALLLFVQAYRRGSVQVRDEIFRAYLEHAQYVNNWDLVDASAEHIVGTHLGPKRIEVLEEFAHSDSVWKRRIAILATFHFIKRGEFPPTLRIATLLLHDRHDLIHKAVGWMLREVGKRDAPILDAYIREHYATMPRTMLRYAIELHPEPLRRQYLAGTI